VLYVVILSAALDLVASVPKGVVLFCNIAPSLVCDLHCVFLWLKFCQGGESWLALSLEGGDTIHSADPWMLCSQLYRHACKIFSLPRVLRSYRRRLDRRVN
jgi:hypothetical protein